MTKKAATQERPSTKTALFIVTILLLLAMLAATSVAWFVGVIPNRDNQVAAANYSGGVMQLEAYDARDLVRDGSVVTVDSRAVQVIDLATRAVLDNGFGAGADNDPTSPENAGEFQTDEDGNPVLDEDGNPIRNTLFTEVDWYPGNRVTKYLVVVNYDLAPHDYDINFVNHHDADGSGVPDYLAEAICTNLYYCGSSDDLGSIITIPPQNAEYSYFEVGLDEMIKHPVSGSVPAAALDGAAPGGKKASYSVYRFDFEFSETSSKIYQQQKFGLDAYISVGQHDFPAEDGQKSVYDRRLAIRSYEDLRYAYATAADDGTPLDEAAREADRRRARPGDTVYILDDITIPATLTTQAAADITITYQTNLYFYGNLSFETTTLPAADQRLSRLIIDIAPEYGELGPMDLGEAAADGRILFPVKGDGAGGCVPDFSVLEIRAPELVTVNWQKKLTGCAAAPAEVPAALYEQLAPWTDPGTGAACPAGRFEIAGGAKITPLPRGNTP